MRERRDGCGEVYIEARERERVGRSEGQRGGQSESKGIARRGVSVCIGASAGWEEVEADRVVRWPRGRAGGEEVEWRGGEGRMRSMGWRGDGRGMRRGSKGRGGSWAGGEGAVGEDGEEEGWGGEGKREEEGGGVREKADRDEIARWEGREGMTECIAKRS